jgi:mercuric ion transport protein
MKSLRYLLPVVIITALSHSLCCILPLFTVLAGLGGLASSLHTLEQYRPFLIALNLSILAWAYYRHYRARMSCACEKAHSRKHQISRLALWASTAFSLLMLWA